MTSRTFPLGAAAHAIENDRPEDEVRERPGGTDHDPVSPGLEVRLARVDERVREDHHEAQPGPLSPAAVMRERKAVSRLVQRDERRSARR